ncbi:hypothetical protein GTP41_08405 [Pseudoduganella sp. DS3]|uniref:Uncharacterized protein n=1 Tax=Pseudoduganella guangdongensis TaxID=2692179 RepID=A0A6N9HF08_9BURK|nr:hypothetical protein [Pseudoduganella guangdongensis]MYN02124.1 hypothetical protein [Pseudoduganella guangdongensis]
MNEFLLNEARKEVIRIDKNTQRRLLTAQGLAQLAGQLGLSGFSDDDVLFLWEIGLLRADLVEGSAKSNEMGIEFVCNDVDDFFFVDTRCLAVRENGYGGDGESRQKYDGITPLFHPFRIYVLHHVARVFSLSVSQTQFLKYEEGTRRIFELEIGHIKRWTSKPEFRSRFSDWNCFAELAIVTERLCYPIVFSDVTTPLLFEVERKLIYAKVDNVLREVGVDEVEKIRQELAWTAGRFDDNRSIHVLLRLMNARERSKLKGSLGAAMHILSMAECIRRVGELVFERELSEEDEIGPGQWMDGARRLLYGTERVFDAPKDQLRDYLQIFGLDFGVKVRCYVEGESEYGALAHAVDDFPHVQLVNLRGRVAEKKSLAFLSNLKADHAAGVFSVIMIDGDNDDYIRMVKKAAKEKVFFGRFFISSPDIECENFSDSELLDIAQKYAEKLNVDKDFLESVSKKLNEMTVDIKNNNDLWKVLSQVGLTDVRKGEAWGRALMEYAISHPYKNLNGQVENQQRMIIEAATLLVRMRDIGFLRASALEEMDPETGEVGRRS